MIITKIVKDAQWNMCNNNYQFVIHGNTMKVQKNGITELEIVYLEDVGQVVYLTDDSDDTVILPAIESAHYVEWGDFQFYTELIGGLMLVYVK